MRAWLIAILFVTLAQCASAQDTARIAPDAAVTRPKIALVLSGGGARGFSHIGVLKVLRELNVPIDMVVGTSMGAVVGGAYAAGYPIEQLDRIMRETPWNDVFTTKAPRQDLDFRRKEEDSRTISRFAFGLTLDGLVLPRGTFRSHVLDEVLRKIAAPSLEVEHLDQLALPFRSVATDLVGGELVVLDQTSLFNAMRASMSIPGAFVPLELGSSLLVDGGLARNLPIDVARKMGADIIIAVNVGTPLAPRENLTSALAIAQQMINILTEQNVKQSLSELTPADILIAPDLNEFSFADFAFGMSIAARGEKAARTQSARLKALAVTPAVYMAREKIRVARTEHPERVRISQVLVQHAERSNANVLKSALGITAGDTLENEDLAARVRKLGARGEFERIDFKLLGRDMDRVLVVQPTEVEWGGNTLRMGLRLQSDFKSTNQFDLLAAHTATWVNSLGGEWRNIIQIGGTRRFESEFYQPVSRDQDWFITGSYGYLATDADLYANERRIARWVFAERKLGAYVGRRLGLIGEVRVGHAKFRTTADPLVNASPAVAQSFDYRANEIAVRLDTHDSANFPRNGFGASAGWQHRRSGNNAAGATQRAFGADWALSSGPYTLLPSIQFADAGPGGSVAIGGFLSLSGTLPKSLSGGRAGFARIVGFRRIGAFPSALGGEIYAGASLELGGAFARDEPMTIGNMKRAGALVLGAETIIGPLYLGAGKTLHGNSAFYLFLGQP